MKCSVFLIGVVVLGALLLDGSGVRPLAKADLDGVFGGGCESCYPQPNPCKDSVIGKPCQPIIGSDGKPVPGYYFKWEGTNIIQKFCQDTAKGLDGKDKSCEATDIQVCVRLYTCTNAACTTCGPATTEKKPTDCDLKGKPCKT